MIRLLRCNSENKDFKDLVNLLNLELNSKYGELQAGYDKYNKIEDIDTVVVAYLDDSPIGCGCYKKYDNMTVEIKRMFVKSEKRGIGVAKKILGELEYWAKENGYEKSILETGSKQDVAIVLYEKSAYKRIDNYGQYIGNSNSICMSKKLLNSN